MKQALSIALLLLILAATGGILVLARDAHEDLASLHVLLQQSSVSVAQLDQTIAKINSAADTLNASAGNERKNWQATSFEAAATGRALRLLISRVDRSFVDGTLLHVNAVTLPGIDHQVDSNGEQLRSTLAKFGASADGVTQVAGTLNARLDDPQIPQLFAHLSATSANFAAISANGVAMSDDMRLAVHRLAQPPSKFHEFLNASWTALKFGSLFVPP
jgi:hypothetical protein